ncbi:GntR family transcriptional regulator [Protaetiibacter intestinalis]|uniref:GntR family transcriptional regulator n=1 Tax=Protaetiibacter intestinalis TaxID=2419774 RepID=A0A387B5F4_9MICO|nr:GntR family transcriptional regulator [Protaetiibacter intestinalis]AYF96968.1 GntR family transcriptional regulator [Protaetiibacter intestinalis]
MLIRVDPASGVAIYDQIAASVRSDASRGVLHPGDRLPAARELADALDVNIHTVLRAYQQLRDEGLVDLRRGRGAVLTDAATRGGALADAVRELVAAARREGVALPTLVSLIREEYPA